MLDAYIIEELKRREREQRRELPRPTIEAPRPREDKPKEEESPSQGGNVTHLDF